MLPPPRGAHEEQRITVVQEFERLLRRDELALEGDAHGLDVGLPQPRA